jgi:2,3-bisphosphoglycerate-independent phosphoglycerate mutase
VPETAQGAVPMLLIVLDGMADRPYPELGGHTPLEAASTPVMDRLVGEGQAGFYYPLGPGRVPSTELSHFKLLGYDDYPFPGRACMEALGHGIPCAAGDTFSFLALRSVVREASGAFRVAGGYGEVFGDAPAGYAELDGWEDSQTGYRFEVFPLPGSEAILRIEGAGSPLPPSGEVTDSDPFFFTDLPVIRPRPLLAASRPEAATRTADALDRFLIRAAEVFGIRPASTQAGSLGGQGAPSADRLVVSKWTGTFGSLPSFTDLTGTIGTCVASTRLMRGLALALGLRFVWHPAPDPRSSREGEHANRRGPTADVADKIECALAMLRSGEAEFAHVHTKDADEASHAGNVAEKVATVEDLDRGLAALLEVPPDRLVLCVTSDHCTPVRGRTVHWGDSVPLLVRGPHIRVDRVSTYGERSAIAGSLGQIGAADLLPHLLCQANRAHFLGAKPVPLTPLGIPSAGEPWLYHDPSGEEVL